MVGHPGLMPGSGYDPAAALPPKLVKRILNLEFVEMVELLPDSWPDDNALTEQGQPPRRARRPPVTDILVWLECFGRLASVLCTKFPDKAAELWAYQTSIVRASRNFEGTAWVAYDRQYRREALARHDLNWSACNARLYNEAFTGRAKVIPRCQHCLSETHGSLTCPSNPDPAAAWQAVPGLPPPDDRGKRREICRNFNDGRCKYQKCRYLHICDECYYPHPRIACHGSRQLSWQKRSRSPRRSLNRLPPYVGGQSGAQ